MVWACWRSRRVVASDSPARMTYSAEHPSARCGRAHRSPARCPRGSARTAGRSRARRPCVVRTGDKRPVDLDDLGTDRAGVVGSRSSAGSARPRPDRSAASSAESSGASPRPEPSLVKITRPSRSRMRSRVDAVGSPSAMVRQGMAGGGSRPPRRSLPSSSGSIAVVATICDCAAPSASPASGRLRAVGGGQGQPQQHDDDSTQHGVDRKEADRRPRNRCWTHLLSMSGSHRPT